MPGGLDAGAAAVLVESPPVVGAGVHGAVGSEVTKLRLRPDRLGRDAGADTDWKMKAEVLTYSRARGIFAGIDLNGAAITQDKDETRVLYGSFRPFSEILNGKVRPRAESEPFLAAVSKYSGVAREHGQLKPSAGTSTRASR